MHRPKPERPSRGLAFALNAFFMICSLVMFAFIFSILFWPPADKFLPSPREMTWQYIICLLLLVAFAAALFTVSLLGMLSLAFCSSFCLSLSIFGTMALIAAQFLVIVFTYSIRVQIEDRLKKALSKDPCKDPTVDCQPMRVFLSSEFTFFVALCVFVSLQFVLLVLSCIICERLTKLERYEASLLKQDEDDD